MNKKEKVLLWYAKNCGVALPAAAIHCPVCGKSCRRENGLKNNNAKLLLITAMIVAAIAVIAVVFCALGNRPSSEKGFRKKVEKLSGKPVISVYFDDYNMDKKEEAFAVAGEGTEDSFTDAEIWFVSDTAGEAIKTGVSGKINGLLKEDGKKYISVEIINGENGEGTSFIYGVKADGGYFEPGLSGKYKNVHQENGKILTGAGISVFVEKHNTADEPSESVGNTSAAEAETTQAETTTQAVQQQVNDTGWIEAYKNTLNELSGRLDTGEVRFTLIDIDRNGTPELAVSPTTMHLGGVMIYAYRDGRTVSLPREDLGSDVDTISASGGEATIDLNTGYIYGSISQSDTVGWGFYKFENGRLVGVFSGMKSGYMDSGRFKYRCKIGESEVSEEEYDAEVNKYKSMVSSGTSLGRDETYSHSLTQSNINNLGSTPIQ